MSINEVFDLLIMNDVATEKEILLVADINGYSIETMLDILYARTGFRTFEELLDEIASMN